jgi:hypothetical protein
MIPGKYTLSVKIPYGAAPENHEKYGIAYSLYNNTNTQLLRSYTLISTNSPITIDTKELNCD